MLISCPACAARYRLDPARYGGRRLSIRCPRCQFVFAPPRSGVLDLPAPVVLLATGNTGLAEAIEEKCRNHRIEGLLCRDGNEAMAVLTRRLPSLLLLDVALAGRYAFEVIQFVRSQPKGSEVRILLLTSSYRRGSFVAKSMDLHGADGNIEAEALAAMAPGEFRQLLTTTGTTVSANPQGLEGESLQPDPAHWNQATSLAKVIAADIVLRYQDVLEESSRTGVLGRPLVEGLAKARQLFSARMGEDFANNYDFVGAALAACLQGRSSHDNQASD